jgi:hypothetical protein
MEKLPPLVFGIVENMAEIFAIKKVLVSKGICAQKEIDEEYEETLKTLRENLVRSIQEELR